MSKSVSWSTRIVTCLSIWGTGLVLSGWAMAHGGTVEGQFNYALLSLVMIVFAGAVYVMGILAMTSRPPIARSVSYFAGIGALIAALVWPLESLADHYFSAHMVQHITLTVVAAPLLVLARPLPVILRGYGALSRKHLAKGATRIFSLHKPSRALVAATGVQVLIMSLWHLPGIFDAAVENKALHIAEHLTLLGSALWFWWALVQSARARERLALATLCTLVTLIHTGMLGGLLTFASRPIYSSYAALGTSAALLDQQLAGLIMWVPAAAAYIAAGLVLIAAMLQPQAAA